MPPSIRLRSASGNTSVAMAAMTRKNMASAIRPQYGRRKGTSPDSERGEPLAGVELEVFEALEGRDEAVEVAMRVILTLKLGNANTGLTIFV